MQIEENFLSTHDTPKAIYKSPASSTSHADVDFFTSALAYSATPTNTTTKPGTSNIFTTASEHLVESTNRIARSFKAVSKKGDNEALANMPNQFSNALFLSQILVKSVGKTSQCIDKICNMQ